MEITRDFLLNAYGEKLREIMGFSRRPHGGNENVRDFGRAVTKRDGKRRHTCVSF